MFKIEIINLHEFTIHVKGIGSDATQLYNGVLQCFQPF